MTETRLTNDEIIALKADYASDGIRLWITDQSDLEAEFCDPSFLESLTGEPMNTCEAWITEILVQNQVPITEQFAAQRAAHNGELHKAGGSPTQCRRMGRVAGSAVKGC